MAKSLSTTPIKPFTTFLLLTLTLFPLLTLTSLSTTCSEYKVIGNDNLSIATVDYIASIVVQSCESSNDFNSFVTQIQSQLNSLYSCSCVNVFADTLDSYSYLTSFEIYQGWYLTIDCGNIQTLIFVPLSCSSSAKREITREMAITSKDIKENGKVYTSDQLNSLSKNGKINPIIPPKKVNNNINDDRDRDHHLALSSLSSSFKGKEANNKETKECDCSSFTWYQSSLSAYYKAELEKAAQYSCEYYPYYDSLDYATYLNYYITYYLDLYPNVVVGSLNSEEWGYTYFYEWYGVFEIGCYATIVFESPFTCTGYKPPSSLPTPTSLATPSTYIPTSSPKPSNTPYPSISPSTSQSIGCGNPPCNDHGKCSSNVCKCSSFYYGPQCQYEYCPGNCSFNGNCDGNTGECQCYYPYYGCDCSSILYNCTCDHGTCNQLNGLCTCDPGWTGSSCNVSVACADNCNNHGRCSINETCDCFFGWTGEFCNVTDLNCTLGCDNGGYCNNITGTCSCPDPYWGPQCSWLHCGTGGTNESCSGHGKCNYQTGSCYCDIGFTGCFCTNWSGSGSPPPAKSPVALPSLLQCGTGGSDSICSGHGQCNHQTGSCYCDAGWHGCYCNQYSGTF